LAQAPGEPGLHEPLLPLVEIDPAHPVEQLPDGGEILRPQIVLRCDGGQITLAGVCQRPGRSAPAPRTGSGPVGRPRPGDQNSRSTESSSSPKGISDSGSNRSWRCPLPFPAPRALAGAPPTLALAIGRTGRAACIPPERWNSPTSSLITSAWPLSSSAAAALSSELAAVCWVTAFICSTAALICSIPCDCCALLAAISPIISRTFSTCSSIAPRLRST